MVNKNTLGAKSGMGKINSALEMKGEANQRQYTIKCMQVITAD